MNSKEKKIGKLFDASNIIYIYIYIYIYIILFIIIIFYLFRNQNNYLNKKYLRLTNTNLLIDFDTRSLCIN